MNIGDSTLVMIPAGTARSISSCSTWMDVILSLN